MIKIEDLCLSNIIADNQNVQKVMVGSNQIFPSTGTLYGEFTVASTADSFKVAVNEDYLHLACSIQYSSDNVNWTNVYESVDVSGSLKWYIRQNPYGPKCTYVVIAYCDITEVNSLVADSLTNMAGMFAGNDELTTVAMFDTSNVTDMTRMFAESPKLTTVPLYDTSNVTTFSSMFFQCDGLISVPLFDTSKAEITTGMFFGCENLTTVPLFNTSNVLNFDAMFDGCTKLTPIPAFNTSKGTDFRNMFRDCDSIVTIPALNTSDGELFSEMFAHCAKLQCIGGVDTTSANDTHIGNMFWNSTELLHPTSAEITDLTDTDGAIYTYDCSKLFYVESFNDGTVGSEWSLGGFSIHSGYIQTDQDTSATLTLSTTAPGAMYIELRAEFTGDKKVILNGTTKWTSSSTGGIMLSTFAIPAGNNTINPSITNIGDKVNDEKESWGPIDIRK